MRCFLNGDVVVRRPLFSILLASTILFSCGCCKPKDTRVPVVNADDLPRRVYSSNRPISEVYADRESLKSLANRVREDISADFGKYRIEDRATLIRLKRTMVNACLIREEYEQAIELIGQIDGMFESDSESFADGFPADLIVKATFEVGDDEANLEVTLRRISEEGLASIDWQRMDVDFVATLGQLEILNGDYEKEGVLASMDRAVSRMNDEISIDMIHTLFDTWVEVEFVYPLRDVVIDSCKPFVLKKLAEREDIWPGRSVNLDGEEGLTPVVVAIWDSGVDVSQFEGRMWKNEGEELDKIDNDGNSFVDDVYGIAHGMNGERLTEMMEVPEYFSTNLEEVVKRFIGYTHLITCKESSEAKYVRELMAGFDQSDMRAFEWDLFGFSHCSHGTHVAYVAAEGNPYVRLLVARADYHGIPFKPAVETARWYAIAQEDAVDYFKKADVRVVNMSWSESRGMTEHYVERFVGGVSAETRANLAREIFNIISDSLYNAIAEAPEILFVTSAGNLSGDVDFDELIPSTYDLPNLVAVGAVDPAGHVANMSSYGDNVKLFAKGIDVDGVLPGGRMLEGYGTSMSSPGVANLAAKLLAIDPSLTPVQVIELISSNADPIDGDKSRLMINPKKTVEALRKRNVHKKGAAKKAA